MNDHDVFWLARYAHNTLAPLFAQARLIEPTVHFYIEMGFATPEGRFCKYNTISVDAHWARTGMFQQSSRITDKAGIDKLAAKIRKDISALKVAAA